MKKLLSIAVCVSAAAAFATDVLVPLGDVGVTAITSSTTNTIVAVSYADLASGGNITASNVVKTANLTIGDYLYVYDGADFKAFQLSGDSSGVKYWQGVTTASPGSGIEAVKNPAASADSTTVAVGKGVWLVRGSGWNGESFTFYIYGKPATETSVSVPVGTSMLVGNPTQTGKVPTFTTGPNNGDKILVPNQASKTGMRTYTYVSGTGWRYSLKQKDGYGFPPIPAGSGFWYVAAGAVTMTW